MPSVLGFIRETVSGAADDLRTAVRHPPVRLNLWPRAGQTRSAPGPGGGSIKETYLGGRWWRYSAGRSGGYEPEALNGDSIAGPPRALVRAHQARQARTARPGRTRGRVSR
jgi:hypothetical protein